MADVIETTEAPNWLKELEAKREARLKARLGHETGAGAPCLTCETKCPGLDLHFWRKICKNCKCAKENHDVHDDDIYGLAQFQLLGSKPKKGRKFVIPSTKKEVDLDWAPMGSTNTVDKYLKSLPQELLAIKGSAAAQERKQLLQKQIPIHDIDPTLCHELSEAELLQMDEYVAHIKQHSVGVGKLVQLDEGVSIQSCKYSNRLGYDESEVRLPKGLANFQPKNVDLVEVKRDPMVFKDVGVSYGDKNTNFDVTSGVQRDGKILPHFACSNLNRVNQTRQPQKIDNIRDLAYSTYDPISLENNFANPNHNVNVTGNKLSEMKIYDPKQMNVTEDLQKPTKPTQKLQPNHIEIQEQIQNPSYIPIGTINDIEYLTHEPQIPPKPTAPCFTDPETNKQLFACHRCKKPFDTDAIVIGIERSDALYHSSCFKCRGCNQNLADLVYFYDAEHDDVFCGRDYAKIRGIPRCKACDELIFVKEYTLAENSTFHIKHFCCFVCDLPLAGKNYVIDGQQPLCLPCYEEVKADRCCGCGNVIKPDEQGANLKGSHFHATDACFGCRVCGKPLLGSKFLFRNQKLYCSAVCYGADN